MRPASQLAQHPEAIQSPNVIGNLADEEGTEVVDADANIEAVHVDDIGSGLSRADSMMQSPDKG